MSDLGQSVSWAFAVPTHALGTTSEPRSRWERGSHELAHVEAFERHFGVEVPLSDDAAWVRQQRWMRLAGLLP